MAQKGLNERWRDEIVDFCQRAIEGRYPFARGASLEVKLADFGRFHPFPKYSHLFRHLIFVDGAAGILGLPTLPQHLNFP